MSRNAPIRWLQWGSVLCAVTGAWGAPGEAPAPTASHGHVVAVQDARATEAFQAQPEVVRGMVGRGMMKLTGRTNTPEAWRTLVGTQDVVGIKVYCAPGSSSGTRPAVVAAIVEGLLAAKVPASNVIIWDRQKAELRLAGFVDVAERLGVRCEGAANAGFDEATFYEPERQILGQLVYGDLEFGRKGDGLGRRSYVSKLVSRSMTKIINVTPMLNHNTAGVCGHLFSLATGSVDNVLRFETATARLATAVPEIFALPALSDRVVLNVTDALICQYHGEQRSLLHYSVALNELRFSRDAVALDLLSLRELDRQRQAAQDAPTQGQSLTNYMELIQNAALLELGAGTLESIKVERAP